MIGTQARWSLPGGVLVLAVMLSISGATIANGSEGQSTDPALQAEWLQQHFRCDHATEMDAA